MQNVILFVGSYPDLHIGYSKISNILTNFLAELPNTRVYHFGFSNFPNSVKVNRKIDSRIELIDVYKEETENASSSNQLDIYGTNIFIDTILKIKPDIIFFYNDVIVISRLINVLITDGVTITHPYKVYTYLDLVYDYQRSKFINHIIKFSDKIFVFSDHWKQQIQEYINILGQEQTSLHVLYHGFDVNTFKILPTAACKHYFGLKSTDFIILNSNRNSYRKALDITIHAFLMFLRKCYFGRNIKLFLHSDLNSTHGYDILDTIETCCLQLGIIEEYPLIIKHHIIRLQDYVDDSVINLLYNACDVGINTCIGEGFGLCNMEHGMLGKPQIVSNVGGLSDIFKDMSTVINPVTSFQVSNICDEHNGIGYLCSSNDICEKLYDVYNNYNKYKTEFLEFRERLLNKYDWDIILKHFKEILVDEYYL